MTSCHNCRHKSHEKQTRSGPEPVCGLPGVPRNWRPKQMKYKDIADECNVFKPVERKVAK